MLPGLWCVDPGRGCPVTTTLMGAAAVEAPRSSAETVLEISTSSTAAGLVAWVVGKQQLAGGSQAPAGGSQLRPEVMAAGDAVTESLGRCSAACFSRAITIAQRNMLTIDLLGITIALPRPGVAGAGAGVAGTRVVSRRRCWSPCSAAALMMLASIWAASAEICTLRRASATSC